MALKAVIEAGWDIGTFELWPLPPPNMGVPPGCTGALRLSCGGGSPELQLTCPSIQSDPGDTNAEDYI